MASSFGVLPSLPESWASEKVERPPGAACRRVEERPDEMSKSFISIESGRETGVQMFVRFTSE
jgi:hypothetical protein